MESAGYAKLVRQYNLAVIPPWHESGITSGQASRAEAPDGRVKELFPAAYGPSDELGAQLEFALKYDGVNLLILARLFAAVAREDITSYIQSKPTGKYARRIWYLYELLTGVRLPIENLTQGNYVELLDPEDYYTSPGRAVPRQRIRDNLLGDRRFCPMIRRSSKLLQFEASNLGEKCRQLMKDYPLELLRRALSYLYSKESKSSFEIEHIKPTATRTERFVGLLQTAEKDDFFQKAALVDVQNQIVDERFRDRDYRATQNYVGESVSWHNERVHFVAPKPNDLASLMDGMFFSHERMNAQTIHPVVHAAVIAYGFVFMHPFEDANGRIHRFLIHNILSRRNFTPTGIMFPVSAVMLKKMEAYEASLEAFSRPIMPLVEYSLDDQGRMSVHNETADLYRYIDFTAQAEALFEFIRETIEVELVAELHFLVSYDNTRHAIQEIVDMPDRLIDLFIRCCLQNRGKLSNRKRDEFFAILNDQEVARMEDAVQRAYQSISDGD
ncbi:MAG TPA: Fic family protein [Humisphaera sp.]|nr:Fic family protein [Humisphaera sp.]